jgi:SAM-dependent methyltransferase
MNGGAVFGEVADTYDRQRPTAPPATFDDLFAAGELGPGSTGLEIGCGTGLATTQLVRRGLEVTAIDPDRRMLEVARERLSTHGVRFVEGRFEDYPPGPPLFDLIFGASSWHWVDPTLGLPLVASLLAADGILAVCWNMPRPEDSPRPPGLDAVFAELAPDLAGTSQVVNKDHEHRRETIARSEHFAEPVPFHYFWSRTLSATEYCELLSTHSDFRKLPPDRLRGLLAAVGDVVAAAGGEIQLVYETVMYVAGPRGR